MGGADEVYSPLACQLSEGQGITGLVLRLRTWSEVVQPSTLGSPNLESPKSRMWQILYPLAFLFHYKIFLLAAKS